ncbi:MAG TPA: DUF3014 domain-containing protein [Steroidobacteraceae bacterium]
MKQEVLWVLGAVALVALGALFYFQRQQAALEQQGDVNVQAPAATEGEAQIQNPVPAGEAGEAPLPALNESDAAVRESLVGLLGEDAVAQFLVPKDVVRHFVVTIDNLSRKKVAVNMRPVTATPGEFATAGEGDNVTLDPANYARYTPLVQIIGATDSKQVAALYTRFYPLLQQAYENLGYPSAYFNDRLVEVIDHLLETPEINGPIKLVQPRVYFEFADPALESRSAGQKLLIRMGNENAAVIKAKLTELRAEVAAKAPT